MKKTVNSQKMRWKAITEIIAKYGTTSPTEICNYLKSEYAIETTRQTVTTDLKNDLENMNFEDFKNIKSKMLGEIEELIQLTYARAKSGNKDALKAAEVYNRLFKTKAEVVKRFEEMKLDMVKKDRPIYNIIIGKPKEVETDE